MAAVVMPESLDIVVLEELRQLALEGAGLNQMGQSFIMSDRNAHLSRVGLCGCAEAILQSAIPAPQHGQLHSFAYDCWQILEKKIEPLLCG